MKLSWRPFTPVVCALAVLAALGVGFAEALFSFWASNFKEVLVFTLIIPVLAWRSVYAPHAEETE